MNIIFHEELLLSVLVFWGNHLSWSTWPGLMLQAGTWDPRALLRLCPKMAKTPPPPAPQEGLLGVHTPWRGKVVLQAPIDPLSPGHQSGDHGS